MAYEFDAAVGWFGRYVEKHLNATKQVGPKGRKRSVPKWTLKQILTGEPIRPTRLVSVDRLNTLADGDVIDV